MRIFLAGATGAIGRRLTPALLAAGHTVVGTTRSSQRVAALRATGAEAVVCDALDADAVLHAVGEARPEAIIHQLTALPQRIDPRRIESDFKLNDRLRTEGTRNLVAAAAAHGVDRIVAQSIAFAYAPGNSGSLRTEEDPLRADPSGAFSRSARAIAELEREVLGAKGVVLRNGYFYGPGTALARDGSMGQDAGRRRLPIVGSGHGVWSMVQIDDAAAATVAAVDHDGPAVFNIVDDEPARVADWLPAFAAAVGAPPPRRVPAWLARLVAGSYAVEMMTSAQGASNARARRELGWRPAHPSWREGFDTL